MIHSEIKRILMEVKDPQKNTSHFAVALCDHAMWDSLAFGALCQCTTMSNTLFHKSSVDHLKRL